MLDKKFIQTLKKILKIPYVKGFIYYKDKICLNGINKNDNLFILYNIITNLHLYKYIKDVFELVNQENDYNNFALFIDYFDLNIKKYQI